MKECVKR